MDTAGPEKPIGLIGGVGMTEVHVYAQRRAPDGLFSGCPHVHAVTDEGYFVLQGSGWVEFHDLTHGFRKLPLAVGDYVHFPPLVMHRLVSDGDLVILGLMGNAGLAERGEARIYFGRVVDEEAGAFEAMVSLPRRLGLEGALQRRDASVSAYMKLMDLWSGDRPAYFAELRRFWNVHCAAMSVISAELLEKVQRGPMAWAAATEARIAALPTPSEAAPDVRMNRRGSESALGMCGVLRPMLKLEDFDLRSVIDVGA